MSAMPNVTEIPASSSSASVLPLRVVEFILRLPVVAVFAIAGYGKMESLDSSNKFIREIRAYHMVPDQLASVMAFTLPWVELVCAALLLIGLWRRESRAILLIMLVVFTAAKSIAFAQNLPIDCGCVSKDSFLYPFFSGTSGLITNLVLIASLIAAIAIDAAIANLRRRTIAPSP